MDAILPGTRTMPLEHSLPDAVLPIAERRQAGRELRKLVPRSLHAHWPPAAGDIPVPRRRDPVRTLVDATRHHLAHIQPVRFGRMRSSPLAFFRGSASIMAADLAETPASGLWVQAIGDCHLGNFTISAAANGTPVFDLADFDETLPAPFEWDLKRLATSFAVDALERELGEKTARQLARIVALAYRVHLAALARLAPLDAWRSRIDAGAVLAGVEDVKARDRALRQLQIATDAAAKGYPRLIEKRRDGWRIRDYPPFIQPLSDQPDDTHELVARTAFGSYRLTLPEDARALLSRYKLVDVAFKLVGVGKLGPFCALGLFATPDDATLLLQLREAHASVLTPYAGPGVHTNQGQRVAIGQRILQAEDDMFLGWTREPGADQHCYVRQFRDGRLTPGGANPAEATLPCYATLCGAALARAHARSGDAARIAGYLGSGAVFDTAIAGFAIAYAAQNEQDWRLFQEAAKGGVIDAEG